MGVLFLHKGERGSANDVTTGSLGPGVYVVMELWHVAVGGGKGRASTMSKHFVTKLFICIIPISHGTKSKVQEGGQGEMPGDEIRHRRKQRRPRTEMERSARGEGENEVVQGNHPVPCWWAKVRGELQSEARR